MDDTTRESIAEALESLAAQQSWNPESWQRCYDFVKAHWIEELLAYIHDDLIHYDGAVHERSFFGFRDKPNQLLLDDYRQEFRSIATALRARMTLTEAKRKFGL